MGEFLIWMFSGEDEHPLLFVHDLRQVVYFLQISFLITF